MSWSNPDYEHEMPAFDPEPIDDDPWGSPYAHPDPPDDPPDATDDHVSDDDRPA